MWDRFRDFIFKFTGICWAFPEKILSPHWAMVETVQLTVSWAIAHIDVAGRNFLLNIFSVGFSLLFQYKSSDAELLKLWEIYFTEVCLVRIIKFEPNSDKRQQGWAECVGSEGRVMADTDCETDEAHYDIPWEFIHRTNPTSFSTQCVHFRFLNAPCIAHTCTHLLFME